ncbi:energy transducer TonB [Desulforhopalus sp. 52FAK]
MILTKFPTYRVNTSLYQKWLAGLLTLVVAFCINLGLFNLMPYLLHGSDSEPSMERAVSQINVIRLKKPEPPIKKITEKPPEPPKEKRPPRPPSTRPTPTKLTLPFSINPNIPTGPGTLAVPDLPVSPIDISELSDIFSMGELDSPLTVLLRIPAVYPLRAKQKGIEGRVKVRFIVNEEGNVENITVQESEPKDVFDVSVIRSVSNWRFKAGTVDGIAVKTWAETTVRFTLD